MVSVATIADLKALPSVGIAVGDTVRARGFDIGGDGFGGDFELRLPNLPSPAYIDGYRMRATGGGEWWRTDAGPIHTRHVGIKPNVSPGTFDYGGFAASNLARWNAMNSVASLPVSQWLGTGVAPIVLQGIEIDPGIHDMGAGTVRIGDGVTVGGAGSSVSIIRTQQSDGADAILIDGGAEYGANVKLSDFGLKRFAVATAPGFGLRIKNVVRGMKLADMTISGFGSTLRFEDCWEYECDNVWTQSAFRHQLDVFGKTGNATFRGCRFDDTADTVSGIAVKFDTDGGHNLSFSKCAIQRSKRIGMMLKGVRGFAMDGMQFEYNNGVDAANPDLWVESDEAITGRVTDSFFLSPAGNTTGRAINVRSGLPAGSILEVSGCALGNTPYAKFLDIGGNPAMHLHWLDRNAIGATPSTIPSNVIEH